jgi:GntR family transcriptional regulator
VGYRVDPRSDVPPSRQLVEAVLDEVASGRLGPGDRLPSVRALAEEALVNPNTVGKAYRDLEAMGVARGRNGSGVFVTEDGPSVAREARRRETLSALRRATLAAVRAGHDEDEVRTAFENAMAREGARASARAEERTR